MTQVLTLTVLFKSDEIFVCSVCLKLRGAWINIVHNAAEDIFSDLTVILSWYLLLSFEIIEETFLFSKEINVLAELRIDMLPHVVLCKSVKAPHLRRLCDKSIQTHLHITLHQA